MSIQGLKAPFEAFKQIESIIPKKTEKVDGEGGKSPFSSMLGDAIKEVDGLQKTADTQVDNLVMGKEGVTPHTAMIAMEKADMAFQLMNSIRGKIIRAYEEIIRAQV